MAKEIQTRDNGDGTATTILDDGSTVTWNITTGAQVFSTPATRAAAPAAGAATTNTGSAGFGNLADLTPDQINALNTNMGLIYGSPWYQQYVVNPQEAEATTQQQERDRANQISQAQLKNQARQIAISQGSQKAQEWYQQQLVKQASDRLQLDRENAQADQAIRWGGLGMQGLSLLGSLRGPENYAQAANVARGMAGMPNTLMALQKLQQGTGMPLFTAPAGVAAPVTMGSLANMAVTGQAGSTPASNIGAGGSVSQAGSPGLAAMTQGMNMSGSDIGMVPTVGGMSNNPDDVAAYKIAQAGPQSLKVGSLESMMPSEQGMLGSRLSNVGVYLPDFMAGYRRAGVNQMNALAA